MNTFWEGETCSPPAGFTASFIVVFECVVVEPGLRRHPQYTASDWFKETTVAFLLWLVHACRPYFIFGLASGGTFTVAGGSR